MDIKLRFQTFGLIMEIHGRSKEKILPIKLDSMDNPVNIRMVKPRDQSGKAARR